MKKITLQIQDDKYTFFLELINNLGFVKVKSDETDGDTKEEIIANLTEAFKELKEYKEGKRKLRPAAELLNEL